MVRIKGKGEQSRERSSVPLHLSVVAIEKGGPSGCPRLESPTLLTMYGRGSVGKPVRFTYIPAVRVFANGPGDLGSIPGRVIPKTLKMELDTTLLNTQHYKVRFKGKVEQSREWSSALPYTLV